ncbi:MAG: RHS repeat-associated core domain-containing protein [Polyangiales bacterium]
MSAAQRRARRLALACTCWVTLLLVACSSDRGPVATEQSSTVTEAYTLTPCTPATPPTIVPAVACTVATGPDGKAWGLLAYTSSAAGTIAPGPNNEILAGSGALTPPTSFLSGAHTTNVFVPLASTWNLGAPTATAFSVAALPTLTGGVPAACPAPTIDPASGVPLYSVGDATNVSMTGIPTLLNANPNVATDIDATSQLAAGVNLRGNVGVTTDGAFTYEVPIQVAPGRMGMQPNLSLSYNSRTANGILGPGWTLSGLSSIERCKKTFANDGVADAVHFDSTDRYCLDGELLIETPGSSPREFRRQTDPISRIVVDSSDAYGPSHFTVYEKTGHIRGYGYDKIGRTPVLGAIEGTREVYAYPASAGAPTTTWQHVRLGLTLTRDSDRFNNSVVYDYQDTQTACLAAAGNPTAPSAAHPTPCPTEVTPAAIYYTVAPTDPLAQPGTKRVYFTFTPGRPDSVTRFVSGLGLARTQTLKNIQVTAPDLSSTTTPPIPSAPGTVRTYALGYAQPSITHASLLSTITECAATHACAAPLTFQWEPGSETFTDIDTGLTAPVSFDELNGNPWNTSGFTVSSTSLGAHWFVAPADVDNDGKDDLVFRQAYWIDCGGDCSGKKYVGGWYVAYSNGSGFGALVNAGIGGQVAFGQPFPNPTLFDPAANGQLAVTMPGATAPYVPAFYAVTLGATSQSSYPFAPTTLFDGVNTTGPRMGPIALLDLNGDRLPDLFDIFENSTSTPLPTQWISIRRNVGGLFFGDESDTIAVPTKNSEKCCTWDLTTRSLALDIDGSGRMAMMLQGPFGTTSPQLRMAALRYHGSPTVSPIGPIVDQTGDALPAQTGLIQTIQDLVVDLNGDGIGDVLSDVPVSGGSYSTQFPQITIETGAGPRPSVLSSAPAVRQFIYGANKSTAGSRVVDLNLDGLDDVIQVDATDASAPVMVRHSTGADLAPGKPLQTHKPGETTIHNFPVPIGFGAALDFPASQVLDVNGDGLPDLIQAVGTEDLNNNVYNPTLHLYLHEGKRPDVITSVTEAKGAIVSKVTYGPAPIRLSSTDSGPINCTYPLQCKPSGVLVVNHVQTTVVAQGFALTSTFVTQKTYSYGRAYSDLLGRGWLGFDSITEYEDLTNVSTTTAMELVTNTWAVYPFRNAVASRTKTTPLSGGGKIVTYEKTDHGFIGAAPSSPNVSYGETVTGQHQTWTEYDGSGAQVATSTTDTAFTHDAFGNVTDSDTINTAAGLHEHTHIDYQAPDTTNWLFSVPNHATHASFVGATTETREVKITPDATTGEPVVVEREPTSKGATPPQGIYLKTTYYRNGYGQITGASESDDSGVTRMSTVSYDGIDSTTPWKMVNAAGHVTYTAYHPALGTLIGARDANGVTTTTTYDGFGRPKVSTSSSETAVTARSYTTGVALGGLQVSTRRYGPGGSPVALDTASQIDAFGRTLSTDTLAFDGARRMLSEVQYDEYFPTSVYITAAPRFLGDTMDSTMWGMTLRDTLGRPTSVSDNDKKTVAISYSGFTTTTTDGIGGARTETTDPVGRLTSVAEAKTGGTVTTQYKYTTFGQVQEVDAPSATTYRYYDRVGRAYQVVDPSTGTTTTTYDAFGEAIHIATADGKTSTTSYDTLGRALTSIDGDGLQTCFAWDPASGIGGLGTTQSPDGVITNLVYDPYGRLTSEQVQRPVVPVPGAATETLTVSRGIDPVMGRVTSFSYPNYNPTDHTLIYNYAPNGELAGGKGLGVTFTTKTKDFAGRPLSETVGPTTASTPVVTRSWSYTPAGRASRIAAGAAGKQVSFAYQYDAAGLLSERDTLDATTGTGLSQTEKFFHDPLHRLHTWTTSVGLTTYEYDDLGNLRSKAGPDGTTTFTPSATNPYALASASDGSTYGYNAIGQRTSGPSGTIAYTSFGLPKSVGAGTPAAASFTYDGFGNRISKVVSGRETLTIEGLYTRMKNPDGSVQHIYHLMGAIGEEATQVITIAAGVTTTKNYYSQSDHVGSGTVVFDDTGAVVDRQRFDPFGRRVDWVNLNTSAPRTLPPPYAGFTGQDEDDDLGFVNMKGRIYDPKSMRFLTPDPIVSRPTSSQGWNAYSYVMNSPLAMTDPSGYAPDPTTGAQADLGDGNGAASLMLGLSIGMTGGGNDGTPLGGAFDVAGYSKDYLDKLNREESALPVGSDGARFASADLWHNGATGARDEEVRVDENGDVYARQLYPSHAPTAFWEAMESDRHDAEVMRNYYENESPIWKINRVLHENRGAIAQEVETQLVLAALTDGVGNIVELIRFARVARLARASMVGERFIVDGREIGYSARVLERALAEPGPMHNFLAPFDKIIIETGDQKLIANFYKEAKAGYGASTTAEVTTRDRSMNSSAVVDRRA